MAEEVDLFNGTTNSNWERFSLLDKGNANWSISNGVMEFTASGTLNDEQVFVKNLLNLNNASDWNLEIGMSNSANSQLQIFISSGANNFSDYFGVTLKSFGTSSSNIWGAEKPGHQYWGNNGITAIAGQQGSIKIDYVSSTGTYTLFYANGGIDPISDKYTYSLLHSYTTLERGNVNLYVGLNTDDGIAGNEYQINSGEAYVDNLKIIPEPSTLSLITFSLGGLIALASLRKNK